MNYDQLKAENDALRKDAERVAYLIKHQAIVEYSDRLDGVGVYWLEFPGGERQSEVHQSANAAIDAMIERERVWR